MRFSVLCTYYDKQVFERHTLRTLNEQTYRYFEFLLIDNSNGRCKSAGEAYNSTAAGAKGDFLIIVHQDVSLYSPDWLATLARLVENHEFGMAGCSGMSRQGQRLGFIKDRKAVWGRPFCCPQKAQTVDESIMIMPKEVFLDLGGFDHSLGWNSYGADLSLKCAQRGSDVLVFPLFLWHDSPSALRGVEKQLWQLRQRYGRGVHTTSGSTNTGQLIINSFKSFLPRWLKNKLVTLLSALGLESEGNVLSSRLSRAGKVLLLDLVPDCFSAGYQVIPQEIELERFSNNPIWPDLFIRLVLLQDLGQLQAILQDLEADTIVLLSNDLLSGLPANERIEIKPFSASYSLLVEGGPR
ncbi:MAG: glycosyltransferase family 2 protein [Candidatus Saganbacteria bacterium]|nr:glycosyltransferase family 2 protein [Candidatus Saganbacteria bacterium]